MSTPELLLIFTASAMGSLHCAAMCGGFTLSLTRPGRLGSSLARMGAYHIGKLFTYVFIGAIAGLAGTALLGNPSLRAVQAVFSALAGVAVVIVGFQALGLVPGLSVVQRVASRLWLGPFLGPFFKAFRERRTVDAAFLLGVFNGFLPCGLVYAAALAAATTGSIGAAMLVMLALGLGTVPMLVAVGLGGTVLAGWQKLRPTLTRSSGVLLLALGVITGLRGTPLLTSFAATPGGDGHAHHTHGNDSGSTYLGLDLEPAPAPHFELTDQDGRPVSLHDFHGRVVVLDFMYTTCATTCPLLTATFRAVQDGLGSDFGKDVALVSITVDPVTDTPEVLRAFGQEKGADFSGWTFLTGDPASVQAVASGYAVYVERTADGLSHTETIVMIDRHGQLRSVFGLRTDPQTVLARARQLANEH